MEFKIHTTKKGNVAELIDSEQIINNLDDAVDLLGNASYNEAQMVIVKQEHLHADFFELRTRLAGDILQKFSNYRMRLAIVGDFSSIQSKSLRDFIFESNKLGQISFVSTIDEAFSALK
jgi:hypothetical protein